MNAARLLKLGFRLGPRAPGGLSQGAWLATGPTGQPLVLKWSPDVTMADRYAALLPSLDQLRARGVPIPEYLHVLPFEGGTLSAQEHLPGRSEDNPSPAVIESVLACVAAQAGLAGPKAPADPPTWGALVVERLGSGHEPLRSGGARCASVLDRIEAVSADADPSWFPDEGLVHRDLHTDNVLVAQGVLSGIIDWEEACAGDPRYDLVQFAFDLDGHDQAIWEVVNEARLEPRVLRVYLALLVLKCTAAAIQHRPSDVARQLARAERVIRRYEL